MGTGGQSLPASSLDGLITLSRTIGMS
ncbi:hypothetical protein LINPERPRIM_LOCUS12326 [Linum perenne]